MGTAKSNLTAGALGVLILLALVSILRQCRSEGPAFDIEAFGGLGGYAANRVVEFLGPGKRVVLILFDESGRSAFGKDEYAFVETLKQHQYRIKATATVSPGPLLSDPMAAAETGVLSMQTYLDLSRNHPNVDAVVSFVGPPVPVSDPPPEREAGHPPLVIARSLADDASLDLVESGFAEIAIVQRVGDAGLPPSANGDAVTNPFDQMLEVVTADR